MTDYLEPTSEQYTIDLCTDSEWYLIPVSKLPDWYDWLDDQDGDPPDGIELLFGDGNDDMTRLWFEKPLVVDYAEDAEAAE